MKHVRGKLANVGRPARLAVTFYLLLHVLVFTIGEQTHKSYTNHGWTEELC